MSVFEQKLVQIGSNWLKLVENEKQPKMTNFDQKRLIFEQKLSNFDQKEPFLSEN